MMKDLITTTPRRDVLPGINFPDYRALPAVNASTLNRMEPQFDGCPAESRHEFLAMVGEAKKDEEATEAQAFGTLYHSFILEPERFKAETVVLNDAVREACFAASPKAKGFSKALKAYKDWKAEQDAAGRTVVDEGEILRMDAMRDAILADPDIAEELAAEDARLELTILFGWPLGNGEFLQCKARLDHVQKETILDLKTAREVEPEHFARSAVRYGYDRQLAFYRVAFCNSFMDDPLEAIKTEVELNCGFFAQKKTAPFVPALHWMPSDWLDYSHREMDATVHRFADCIRTNHWPTHGATVLMPPTWMEEAIDSVS